MLTALPQAGIHFAVPPIGWVAVSRDSCFLKVGNDEVLWPHDLDRVLPMFTLLSFATRLPPLSMLLACRFGIRGLQRELLDPSIIWMRAKPLNGDDASDGG